MVLATQWDVADWHYCRDAGRWSRWNWFFNLFLISSLPFNPIPHLSFLIRLFFFGLDGLERRSSRRMQSGDSRR